MQAKPSTQKKKGSRVHPLVWVVLFCALCFGLYSHAIYKKRQAIFVLEEQLSTLQEEKEELLIEKEELLLNIHSQSDPAWIEMILMKVLGLVPEGKVKVYFEPTSENN